MTEYPFARELITDVHGRVSKVVRDVRGYQELLEILEDVGLYQAMRRVKTERPLSRRYAVGPAQKDDLGQDGQEEQD